MVISKRLSKAELHFYIQKLYTKGFSKIKCTKIKGGTISVLKCDSTYITIRTMKNGWITIEH